MRRTTQALTLITALCVVVAIVVRVRRRPTSDPVERGGDIVPGSTERREALVDDAAEDSFPASDPPSYWGRETGG